MTVSSDTYFSNAIVGVPQVGGDVDIFAQHVTPRFAIGTKFERQDGAIFRYAHFGAAINSAGLLLSQDVSQSSVTTGSACIALTSTSYAMPDEPNGTYPNNKGSKYLIVKEQGLVVTADLFAGGYISITSSSAAPVGTTYRIRGNVATGTPVASYFRVELYEKLSAHVASNTCVRIVGHKHANLTYANVGNSDTVLAGVSILSSGTAYPFGWVLTRGICAVLNDTTTPIAGKAATLTSDTALSGCVGAGGSTSIASNVVPQVGWYVDTGSASTFNMVQVLIE